MWPERAFFAVIMNKKTFIFVRQVSTDFLSNLSSAFADISFVDMETEQVRGVDQSTSQSIQGLIADSVLTHTKDTTTSRHDGR
jgi:hypothetical protein